MSAKDAKDIIFSARNTLQSAQATLKLLLPPDSVKYNILMVCIESDIKEMAKFMKAASDGRK